MFYFCLVVVVVVSLLIDLFCLFFFLILYLSLQIINVVVVLSYHDYLSLFILLS